MQKYVHIIPIESITDKICPAFKDEFVNNLSEREVLALAVEATTSSDGLTLIPGGIRTTFADMR